MLELQAIHLPQLPSEQIAFRLVRSEQIGLNPSQIYGLGHLSPKRIEHLILDLGIVKRRQFELSPD